MDKVCRYYLVDMVAEKIVGSFLANSDAFALKVMRGFDFKKAQLEIDEVSLFKDPAVSNVCETYDEIVRNSYFVVDISCLVQPDLNFEEK